jgi:hypothetical protein
MEKGKGMSFRKDKQLYNYLVNTLGVSKEFVMNHITSRLDDLIVKHLNSKLDSKYVHDVISGCVAKILEDGFLKRGHFGMYYDRLAFQDYIKQQVENAVRSRLRSDYSFEVKMALKDDAMIAVKKN